MTERKSTATPLCIRPDLARTLAEVTRLDAGGRAGRTPGQPWEASVTARIGVGDKSLRAELTPADAARFAVRLLEAALFCILPDDLAGAAPGMQHDHRPPGEPLPVATELGVLDAAARLAAGMSDEASSAVAVLREIAAAPLAARFTPGAHRETAAAGKGEEGWRDGQPWPTADRDALAAAGLLDAAPLNPRWVRPTLAGLRLVSLLGDEVKL